jgi:MFS family permease
LSHVLGKRRLLFAGTLTFGVGMAATALASDFWRVLAGNFAIGLGMSLEDIAISTLCIDAHPQGKGKALNRLHFFFGAGAVLGPMVALALLTSGQGWRWAFGLVGLGPLAVALLVPFLKVPEFPEVPSAQKFGVYRKPLLWWGALVLLIYCGVEWGVGAWFPSYWKAIPGTQALDPSWATSLFWLTFALGRFLAGPWADAWGFARFLTASLVAALTVVGLWIAFPQPQAALVWVLLLGFVIAAQYPTFFALVSHQFPESSGQVASFLAIFASLGTFLWPPGVGAWADVHGIQALPWAELVLTLMLFGASLILFASARKRQHD